MAGAWNKSQEGQPWLRNLQATLSEGTPLHRGGSQTEDRVDKGSGNGKTGPGHKRGQDAHPGLLPVATQAASDQAGLRAPPPGKAVLTFSPMVNSSIPIMVKRHRWMASSSPTLGKDSAQHSTARPHPKRQDIILTTRPQAWAQGPLLSRGFSALGQGPEAKPTLLTPLFVVGHNPRDMPRTRPQRTEVTVGDWTGRKSPRWPTRKGTRGRRRAWVTFLLAGAKRAWEGSGELKALRATELPGQQSFTQCKKKLN